MTLRELSALMSTILVVVGTIWYIRLILRGEKVRPVMATWIVLSGTITLSFVTYWTSPNHGLVSGACIIASVLTIWSVLVAVVYSNVKQRIPLKFTPFQKFCLLASAVIFLAWIVIVWGFKGTGILPNVLTQVLMLIGYFVTAQKLLHAKRNTESLFLWWCILLAGAIALYTGWVSHDKLTLLYAIRSTFGTSILVALMYRLERKTRV